MIRNTAFYKITTMDGETHLYASTTEATRQVTRRLLQARAKADFETRTGKQVEAIERISENDPRVLNWIKDGEA